MRKYMTIYYIHRKAKTFERVDFEGHASEADAKVLAAVFRPRGYKLHKIVFTTISGGQENEKA